MTSLVIEGLDDKPSSGFFALDKLVNNSAASVAAAPAALETQGAD
jgi:hypothetical protein